MCIYRALSRQRKPLNRPRSHPTGRGGLAGSVLLASGFVLLVCERTLSFRKIKKVAASGSHCWALAGIAEHFFTDGCRHRPLHTLPDNLGIVWLASLIVLLIALEFLLRTLLAAFVIPDPDKHQAFITQSLIAEQHRWPLHPLLTLRKKIMQHFGVDVGRARPSG